MFAGVTGLALAWSIWWLAGLSVWATLKQEVDTERYALELASEAAGQLPALMAQRREKESETIAWQRLLPIAGAQKHERTGESGRGRKGMQSNERVNASGVSNVRARSGVSDASDASDAAQAGQADEVSESNEMANATASPNAAGTANADDDVHTAWRTDVERLVARAGLVLEFARPGLTSKVGQLEIERAEIRVRGGVANLLGWLAEIDNVPRHLAVAQLSMQGPRMTGAAGTGATGSDYTDATLTVVVAAYRWRRPAELANWIKTLSSDAWPKFPEPSPPWQTPVETMDVFRTPLTRRASQDAATISSATPNTTVDDAAPVGSMRAGSRYVVLRRTSSSGLTATWRYGDSGKPGRTGNASDEGATRFTGPRFDPDASTVDVTLHGVEAADALRAFARLTGRSVVIGERVAGRLDVDVQGVSVATAFDVMIRSAGLGVQSIDGVDWIAPRADLLADEQTQLEAAAKREALLPLAGRRFTLNYPRAQTVREIIHAEKDGKGQRLLSPRGSVIADPRTNQLFVTDLPERLDALASFIARIDVPVRQVLIEARIVEADDRFSESLGVRLAGANGANRNAGDGGGKRPAATGRADVDAGLLTNTSDRNRDDPGPPGSVVDVGLPAAALAGVTPPSLAITLFGRSASRFLQLELSALETSGRGRVVSRPRVVTADKVQALIEQGTELPYQVRNGRRNVASIEFRKATLRLEVTPLITPDGQVILDVDVRKDSVGQAVADGFAVDTRHVRTQVQVENGGTVAIGGIYQEVRRDNRASVPWLGEVPVLGALFRNRSNEDRRTELLVFLTPSVVPEGGASSDAGDVAATGRMDAAEPPNMALEAPSDLPLPGRDASPLSRFAPAPGGIPPGHPRLIGVFPETTPSARPTQIPVSSGIGTQISAIYAGKRNTCRTDGGGQDHGWTRRGTASWTTVL
ncbi:hypothetical protein AB870_26095 [Pandoraea faecigallinarum]|uniref:Type IV pilus biogenesis and competence protein PilQ n=2 Tax=Pandoraea faecigallinarum TaxID=656179 RepID=A0A173H038_9BURK|nr:hypothetical protein AB870_26095 [Pandoraea faecigallinarum]